MTEQSKAWVYDQYGAPSDVLKQVNTPLPELKADEVLLAMLLSPVHPSDIGMISGFYGKKMALPAVAGREGIGKVVATGSEVSTFAEGDLVRIPEAKGVWQEYVVVPSVDLLKVPGDIPVDQAAMAFINPATAYCLLNNFVDLQEGDWVIQNGATSAVGVCVIALAKQMGLKTINVVRDESRIDEFKSMGADHVVLEDSDYFKQMNDLTGSSKPRLGLNSIGGNSVMSIIKSMGSGASLITFGGMTSDKVRFPTRELIFNDIQLRGFWMDRWWREHSEQERTELMSKVYELIRDNVFQMPVDTIYPLSEMPQAIERALEGGRKGKVLVSGPAYEA